MPGGGLEFNCEKPKEQMEDLGISYYQCFFYICCSGISSALVEGARQLIRRESLKLFYMVVIYLCVISCRVTLHQKMTLM